MSCTGQMSKQTGVSLLWSTMERPTGRARYTPHRKLDGAPENYAECKEPSSESHILCSSISITFRNDNVLETEQIIGPGVKDRGELEGGEVWPSKGSEESSDGSVLDLDGDDRSTNLPMR